MLAEWEEHSKTLDVPASKLANQLLAFRNKRCSELLQEESQAVKDEVEKVRQLKHKLNASDLEVAAVEGEDDAARETQRAEKLEQARRLALQKCV